MGRDDARRELITLLQMAYSGERAAAYAYIGHQKSLRRPKRADDRAMLRRVLVEEIQHRRIVRRMLRERGEGPDEAKQVTNSSGGTATVGPKANFGTLSAGGLY